MDLTIKEFKQTLGSFTTGVAVVTTLYQKELYGITVSSFSSLSLEPALILFNIDKKSNGHKILLNSKNFTVNILSDKQLYLSKYFAQNCDNKNIDFSVENKIYPILNNSLAHIYCDNYQTYAGGDHTIFIGKVNLVKKHDDLNPLVYFQGTYKHLGENIL